MFANVCPKCGKREIVFSDQIRDLRQTGHGFDVRYVCSCGALVTWHVERESHQPAAQDTQIATAA
jgi:hypothetical protein